MFFSGIGFNSDFWTETARQVVFASLTIYFCQNERVRYYILKSDEFPDDEKTAINIKKWFDQTLVQLKLSDTRNYLVTDSASNYVAAFNETGQRIRL